MSLGKKLAGLFVTLPPGKPAAPAPATPASVEAAPDPVPAILCEDLVSDPAYQTIQKASNLLAKGLDPKDVLETMKEFGQDTALMAAFDQIVPALEAQVEAPKTAIRERRAESEQRLSTLNQAIEAEKQDCAEIVSAMQREQAIAEARLAEINRVRAAFTNETPE